VRQLYVVALSEDGRSVLLATSRSAKTGGFSVLLDDRLAAALRGDLPRPGEEQVRDSGVTPKEIQARLRAGESPEQIAASAGVPVARVERFAGPVLSERERIIDEARATYVSRSRRGPSTLPLGDAVDAALAETSGLRPESVTWTARRLESGHWLVQVSYVARARTRTSSWVYEPHTRSITASDAASAALGHAGDAPAPSRQKASATARPAAKKPAAKKPAAKKAPAKKAPAKKAPARKAVATKPAAAKTAAKQAKQAAAKQAAAKPPAKQAAAKHAAPKKRAAPVSPPTLRVVPPPAEPVQEPPRPVAKKRAAGERAHVPDWADVLLGAAPHRDRTDG
jgi:hypothetical protein